MDCLLHVPAVDDTRGPLHHALNELTIPARTITHAKISSRLETLNQLKGLTHLTGSVNARQVLLPGLDE
eukprot:9811441-Alexandrium_andersonii.AAC.1